MIEIRQLEKKYVMGKDPQGAPNVVYALKGASLKIEDGEFVAIMGPSGSGKSTLMHILGLLDTPDSGSYLLNGKEVSALKEDELAVSRREAIGFIFQQFNLLPRMNALENVALPLLYSEKQLNTEKGKPPLEQVGLTPRAHHRPNELSGGQQQRVAIARALVNKPRMILADEPTGNLDSASEKEIMGILNQLNESGITIVIVTHEEEIGHQAHRLIRMRDGQIVSDEKTAHWKPRPPKQAPPLENLKPGKGKPLAEAWEYFHQGFKTLLANKIRTGLSMLGILIGVAAVVAMLALGRGAQKAIEAQLASLGSNLLVLRSGGMRVGGVSQGAGSVARLTTEDAAEIKDKVPGVSRTAPIVNGRGQITFLNKNWSTPQVLGVTPAYAQMHASEPDVGRFFSEDENLKRLRVAVIGRTIIRELFGEQNPIGEMIKVNKVNFQVIGILPEKGATGFRDQDDIVVIPVLTAMHRVFGKTYVDSIDIEAASASDTDTVQEASLKLMQSRHRIPVSQSDDAFQIRNMADIQAALSESSKTMGALLASIAAISLLVGGIGIMNIMLVSVTERTREIGLRKAIGAKRWDILSQFLAESIVISAVGGLIGILLGWGITVVLSKVAGWTTSISPSSVVMSFFFSASIGVIFGIYPARKASLLRPIDALRYE